METTTLGDVLALDTTGSYLRSEKTLLAVIGMAGRFPGADGIDEYWRNLRDGKESIHHFSEDELRESKLSESVINNPNYVKAQEFQQDREQFLKRGWDKIATRTTLEEINSMRAKIEEMITDETISHQDGIVLMTALTERQKEIFQEV